MSIRLKNGSYYVEVYLGKDPLTGKKVRKTGTFTPANKKKLKEAKEFEAKWLLDGANGEIDINGNMLLRDYLDYWFKTYALINCSKQTQLRYKTFCKCLTEGIGHISLGKLNPPVIQKFYSTLLLETIKLKNGSIKNRYSKGTVLKTHKMLHLALKWAVNWQMIKYNPTDSVMPPSDDVRNIDTWSINEINDFLELIKGEPLHTAVKLAYRTGMREGEVSALRWEDVDFENSIIRVNHNMTGSSEAKLSLDEPKTKKSKRSVDLDNDTLNWLKSISLHQQEINLSLPKGLKIKFDYICCWEDGRPLRPLYITKRFTSLVERYEFKKITFHGLRHSHASILFQEGISSNIISRRLGHSRTSITDDIYIHVKPQKLKEAAEAFEKALKNAK